MITILPQNTGFYLSLSSSTFNLPWEREEWLFTYGETSRQGMRNTCPDVHRVSEQSGHLKVEDRGPGSPGHLEMELVSQGSQ